MQSPLLGKNDTKANKFGPLYSLIFLFAFCVFATWQNCNQDLEVGVGGEPNWEPLLNTYWALLSLAMTKNHGDAYQLNEDPTVPIEKCTENTQTMQCQDACTLILEEKRDTLSSFCYHISRKGEQKSCWDVSKIGCWNRNGGVPVYEGQKQWILRRHYIGKHDNVDGEILLSSEFAYIHLSSPNEQKELLLFGWGSVRKVEEICAVLQSLPELLAIADIIPIEHEILVGGHSEGSGWAACYNEYLFQRKFPNERRVIATGSLIPEPSFCERMDPYSIQNSLYLLVGMDVVLDASPMYYHLSMLPDIWTMKLKSKGVILPQFGFKCDIGGTKCLGFETDPFVFNPALEWVHETSKDFDGYLRVTRILQDIHAFSNYRQCYEICLPEFKKVIGFNFERNVKPHVIRKIGGQKTNPLIVAKPIDISRPVDESIGQGSSSMTHPTPME